MNWDDLNLDTQNEWITKAEYLIKRGYVLGDFNTKEEVAQKMYLKRINSSKGLLEEPLT